MKLWNYAVKVEDLDAASDFYVATLNGEPRIKGTVLGCDYRLAPSRRHPHHPLHPRAL